MKSFQAVVVAVKNGHSWGCCTVVNLDVFPHTTCHHDCRSTTWNSGKVESLLIPGNGIKYTLLFCIRYIFVRFKKLLLLLL